MVNRRASDSELIESFLEMMSAERAASENTLTAYRRDLFDLKSRLKRRDFIDTSTGHLEGVLGARKVDLSRKFSQKMTLTDYLMWRQKMIP